MKRLGLWIAGLLGRSRFERDMSDELSFHLQERTDHWQRRGLEREDARRRARLEFGDVERIKEEVRDTRFGAWFEQTRQDVRYSARALARNPGFAVVVIMSLALGIGVNATIFAVVDAVMLRPLPYEEPDRLVWVERIRPTDPGASVSPTHREHRAWRQRTDLFDGVSAGHVGFRSTVASEGYPTERLRGAAAGTDLFGFLGVEPILGRQFLAEEGLPDGAPVAILSHDAWQRRFQGDRGALGATLSIDGVESTLVGVMPAGFAFTGRRGNAQFWVPDRRVRETVRVETVARLAPGVTPAQAQAALEADGVGDAIVGDEEWAVNVVPLVMSRYFARDARSTLLVLWGAAGVVLLVACANTAGLLLVRSVSRRRDFALRMALGASRWRVVRLLAAESAVLALAGGVSGAILSVWGIRSLQLLNPDQAVEGVPATFPRLGEAGLDLRALGYILLVSMLTALLFSSVSAVAATGRGSGVPLRGSSVKAVSGAPQRQRGGRLLVVAQIAFTLVLLAGGGLLVHSMVNLWRVDLGFDPSRVLEVRTELEPSRYSEEPTQPGDPPVAVSPQVDVFYQQAMRRLTSLPGVEAAGGASTLPLSHFRASRRFRIEGRPLPIDLPPWPMESQADYEQAPSHGGGEFKAVIGDYFAVMGIPVLRGRALSAGDTWAAAWVVAVNESAAARYWPGEDPIGQQITIVGHIFREPTPGERPREVVAVVADARQWSPQSEPHPVIYVPVAQQPREVLTVGRGAGQSQRLMRMSFVMKTAGEPTQWAQQAQGAIVEVDPEQPVPEVQPMGDVVGQWTAGLRFYTLIGATFAAVSLLLAAVGVYAMLAYSVAGRTHEIGVRMALGADRTGVVKLVVGEGVILAGVGLALGLPVALWLTRLVPALTFDPSGGDEVLFGVSPTEPLTFIIVTALVVGVVALACYRPARRATGVDPMVALRAE